MDQEYIFKCDKCSKKYKYRQNLHRHISLKHNLNGDKNGNQNGDKNGDTNDDKNGDKNGDKINDNQTKVTLFQCKYCNKEFNFNQSRYRHQKTCKHKMYSNNEKIYSKIDLDKEINKISNILIKKFKKLLKEEKIGDNICNNIGNQLNDHAIGTQNNITIVSLGKEDVLNTLSQNEKIEILEKRYMSVLELIKLMHCSDKYPQFNNSIITNLRSRQALTFDEDTGKFVSTNKEDLMKNIVSYRTSDVEDILDENKEDVSDKTKIAVEDVINILSDIDDKQNTNYVKEYTDNAMIAIYNDKDRLTTTKKNTIST